MRKFKVTVRAPKLEPIYDFFEISNDATLDDIADKGEDVVFKLLEIPINEIDGVAADVIWDLLDKLNVNYDINEED